MADGEPQKKTTMLICALIPIIFPIHGIHRFMSGYTGMGILYIFTFGLCWIGTIIDVVKILQGTYVDAQGRPLAKE